MDGIEKRLTETLSRLKNFLITCPNPDCPVNQAYLAKIDFGKWFCYKCNELVEVSRERSLLENELIQIIEEIDILSNENGAKLADRGVTVKYLEDFTNKHDCWHWPTWRVVRDIIIPETSSSRSRYADIITEKQPEAIGPSCVFISHSWAANWGTLVAAVSQCSRDGLLTVWVDVFAVRQWPGNKADLDFKGVVKNCKGLLLVVSHEFFRESKIEDHDPVQLYSTDIKNIISRNTRAKLPFFRSWCLAEIVAAVSLDKTIYLAAGEAVDSGPISELHKLRKPSSGKARVWNPKRSFAPSYFGLLELLSPLIDMEDAEAGLPADKQNIEEGIKSGIGFKEFNREARKALISGSWDSWLAVAILPYVFEGDAKPFHELAGQISGGDAIVKSRFLQTIISLGNIELIETLLQQYGFEINYPSVPAIWVAASSGHHKLVAHLISKWDVDVNARAGNLSTPLANASNSGHLKTVKVLVENGADVNMKGFQGNTALINAALNNYTDVVEYLLQNGADPEIKNQFAQNAIYAATGFGKLETIETLVRVGKANVNSASTPHHFTPLHLACSNGKALKIVELLLNLGADINASALDGSTPIIIAAMNGHIELVELLIRRGANILGSNKANWNMLHSAIHASKNDVLHKVKDLSEQDVISHDSLIQLLNQPNREGHRVLDMAISLHNTEVVAQLVSYFKVDINKPAKNGWTPLSIALQSSRAAEMKDVSIIKLLIHYGANVDSKGNGGISPLFDCQNEQSLMVLISNDKNKSILIKEVNNQDQHGNTAIMLAAIKDNFKLIVGLKTHLKANLDCTNKDNNNAVHLSVIHGSTESTQTLVELGANIRHRNNENLTALEIATSKRDHYQSVVNKLKEKEQISK